MKHGADERVKEQHAEMTIKREMEEASLSDAYVDIDIDLNYIKEEPSLLDITRSAPGLLVKKEIVEGGRQGTGEQRRIQVASTSAVVCSMSITAKNLHPSDMLNIKMEPQDTHIDHTVLQKTLHQTNKLDMSIVKQANTINKNKRGPLKANRLKKRSIRKTQITSSATYICDYCGKIYRTRPALLIHIKKLHGILSHRCTECKIDFVSKRYLENHVKILHPNEKPECELCKKVFKNKQRLGRHFQAVHGKKATDALCSQLFKCTKCLTVSKTKATLRLHCRRVHGKELHKCTECKKEYKCKEYLVNHISYAHGAEKFECNVCKAICKSKQALFNHLSRLHRPGFQPRIYICDYCQRTFRVRSTIQTHIASVHENRTYKCNQCNKNFKCKQYLTAHVIRCNAALREKCNICGKYVRPAYLKQHMRCMHDDTNFHCKVCGLVLRSRMYLRLHVKNLHDQQSADKQQDNETSSTLANDSNVGEAASSADQSRGLIIKDESRDTDLDIGPTVLQRGDSHYRTNQLKVAHVKTESSPPMEGQTVKSEPDLSMKEDITDVDPH